MDLGLDGVVAAVAGGTAGLGLASARALAAEGAVVAVCGRSTEGVAAAQDEGLDATAVDVVDHAAARAWVEDVAARHGGLGVLVANAGGPPAGTATAFDVEAYRAALELSLLSQIALVQAALPHLRRAAFGRVLFVTSKTVREPLTGLALSNTARAGVVGYAKSLVRDLGDQDRAAGRPGTVTVNVLAPGMTRTGRLEDLARGGATDGDVDAGLEAMAAQIPLGRVGRPEEFAATLAFLASARASFVSGVVLPVDGGEIRGI